MVGRKRVWEEPSGEGASGGFAGSSKRGRGGAGGKLVFDDQRSSWNQQGGGGERRGSGGAAMSGILAVPIHGTEDEILELPKDALPEDPNEIMQIRANELAPLKLWLELAVSYYQQHRMEQFQTVMETSTGED
ncbi:hypothetical protein T484DRAFT_1764701 [Baffinella frigidus]|nr:hypothetical protein T484DRAFT_1764701 [Cryptophyta sp. CCMP2293]